MTAEAVHKIDEMMACLEGHLWHRSPIPRLLGDLRDLAEQLGDGERSPEFHSKLRGIIRCWSDEFAPERETFEPLLDALFELHGFPDQLYSNPKARRDPLLRRLYARLFG